MQDRARVGAGREEMRESSAQQASASSTRGFPWWEHVGAWPWGPHSGAPASESSACGTQPPFIAGVPGL